MFYSEDHLDLVYRNSLSFRTGRILEAFIPIMASSLKFTEKREGWMKGRKRRGKGTSSHSPLSKVTIWNSSGGKSNFSYLIELIRIN